jgi:hypothetical protein
LTVDEIGTNAVAITNKDIVAAARDVECGRKPALGLQTYLVANWLSLMDVR